jgi:hypothetical protein
MSRFAILGLIASPFLLFGAFMVAAGLGWISVELHVPGWVFAVLGLPFLGGGLYILDIAWIRQARNMMAVMLIVFAVIVNWAVFTDDTLCFRGRQDQVRPRTSHVVCQEDTEARRFPIVVAAVVLDIVVIAMVAHRLRRYLARES